MFSQKVKNGYILRFAKGTEVIESLSDFCQNEEIKSGFFHGLGGVSQVELGFYELEEQKYHFSKRDDFVELTSLNGNVAWDGDSVVIHAHGTFGDRDLNSYSGHIKSMITAGTIEVYLVTFTDELQRKQDDGVGLKLLDL